MAPKASATGHAETFAALRKMLSRHVSEKIRVAHDKPDYYYAETTFPVWKGKPVMFACVKAGKAYVSYHLLPLYMNPPLQAKVSKELQKRKQGKACFNFKEPDAKLFAQLNELTRLGLESFQKFAAVNAKTKKAASGK